MRATTSPTAITARIETRTAERLEEIIRDHLDPISKQVLGIWLDHCACAKREVGEMWREYLKKKDGLIRSKTIEIDFGPSFVEWFGLEVVNRILASIKQYFTV